MQKIKKKTDEPILRSCTVNEMTEMHGQADKLSQIYKLFQ